ncbi:hypothetical protein PCC7424_0486 [Gloeothece citriformis PCC 7424]|uniref:SH3b domain-containing protein n=1 Tax=Gloeothece citriformis (strain PCC 7424) TaxID=65393 RepID=B7KDD1_GLOC7|nr:SH3 domain-containing protein [Gloeothece citriformis]ACK68951.1 hypothetical protein PCC7424_0486 [Gloeothece citriformis PCC 7424]
MIDFNQFKYIISSSILLSLGAGFGMTSPVQAQIPSTCYMITNTGQYINLSSICGIEQNPTNSQSNAVTGQQTNQNQSSYQQNVTQQQATGQQRNVLEQGTIAIPTGYTTSRQGLGGTVISGQWQPILDSASLRTEPGTGSLVQQLQEGQPVRVYDGMQTNNSVFVETENGQRGWVNIWNLPGGAGVLP